MWIHFMITLFQIIMSDSRSSHQLAGFTDGFLVGLLVGFGDGFLVVGFNVGQLLGLFLLYWQILASTHFAKYDTRVYTCGKLAATQLVARPELQEVIPTCTFFDTVELGINKGPPESPRHVPPTPSSLAHMADCLIAARPYAFQHASMGVEFTDTCIR